MFPDGNLLYLRLALPAGNFARLKTAIISVASHGSCNIPGHTSNFAQHYNKTFEHELSPRAIIRAQWSSAVVGIESVFFRFLRGLSGTLGSLRCIRALAEQLELGKSRTILFLSCKAIEQFFNLVLGNLRGG